jgi:hypothetical protein
LSRHIRFRIGNPSCTEINTGVRYGPIPLANPQRIAQNRLFDRENGRMLHKTLSAKSTTKALGNTMKRGQKNSVVEPSLWPDTAGIERGLFMSSA